MTLKIRPSSEELRGGITRNIINFQLATFLILYYYRALPGKRIEEIAKRTYGVSIRRSGQYSQLQRMKNKGLIKSTWGKYDPDNRWNARTRFYSITQKGKNEYRRIEELILENPGIHHE